MQETVRGRQGAQSSHWALTAAAVQNPDKRLSGRRLQATPVGECDSEMEPVSRSRATNLAWMHELYGGRRKAVVRGPERRERVDMDEHLGPVKPWPDL